MECLFGVGNPAAAVSVKEYLKSVQEEQTRAHIVSKQAKSIFISEVRAIASFIQWELEGKEFLEEKSMFCLGTRRGLSYSILQVIEQETKQMLFHKK